MMNTSWKLAQEIYDEFLTCRICLDSFKSPKSLTCLHVFCELCIENHVQGEASYKKYSDYRDFTCPICRKRTPVPAGGVKKLPDNFLIASLGEMIGRQRPANASHSFCDICRSVQRKHREASSKCLDCNKLLCTSCVETHRETKVTRLHSVFDVEIEKDIVCKEHKDEAVRFYCEPCATCICVLCTFAQHKEHDVTEFAESAQRYQSSIKVLLEKCKGNLNVLESQLETVAKSESRFKEAEQSIHDVALQYISEIRTREKEIVEELQKMYGKSAMELISSKAELQSQVEQLKTTCNLTDLVLSGKDIELLLLRKQLEEKLHALAALQPRETPSSLLKEVKFIPGQLHLGTLLDGESASAPHSPTEPPSLTPNRRKTCCAVFSFAQTAFAAPPFRQPSIADVSVLTCSAMTSDAQTMTSSVHCDCHHLAQLANTALPVQSHILLMDLSNDSEQSVETAERKSANAHSSSSAATCEEIDQVSEVSAANGADRGMVFENEIRRNSSFEPMQQFTEAVSLMARSSSISEDTPAAQNQSQNPNPNSNALMRRRERRRRAIISPDALEFASTVSLDN